MEVLTETKVCDFFINTKTSSILIESGLMLFKAIN